MSLTPEGFDRPRLNNIKATFDQLFIDALGPVNTAPDSVTGQIIGIFSAALDDAYEMLQDNYDSMYPFSAENTALDGAVSYVGLTRLAASPTKVTAILYGDESTLVPAGVLARSVDNRQYTSTTDTVITRANCTDVQIQPTVVTNLADYQVIVGGSSFVYTASASATSQEIADGLASLFSLSGYISTAENGVLSLKSADNVSGFAITVDSKLSIVKLGSPVVFTALELGAFALPAGSLTTIDSQIVGWDEINNLVGGDTGRFVETDEELRLRHLSGGSSVTGAATSRSIRARLLNEVDLVTYVAIYENRTKQTDLFNLPPHSFEVVLSGGINQEVANKLFELKPASIETYGNTSVNVLDENGDIQVVRFSRPSSKFAWVRVSVTTLYPEEALTEQVEQEIINSVVLHGQSLNIGEDIITQRFYGPIYSNTDGIGSIVVEVALTDNELDPPLYSTNNAVISRSELAVFDAIRVIVVGV